MARPTGYGLFAPGIQLTLSLTRPFVGLPFHDVGPAVDRPTVGFCYNYN
jgi:hypothetical protein